MFVSWALPGWADTPVLGAAPPAEDFVGEQYCFGASLTNTGTPGYGPYYQIITKPDYDLASTSFVGLGLTAATVGTFPAAPGNQLVDPISGQSVTGPPGGELSVVRYPIGSVVVGQPPLEMSVCIDVDAGATINVLETDALELVPAYEFGDTPTGVNGATIGARSGFDFTPVVIRYAISTLLTETENPPGPAWTWDVSVTADIASNRTVTPIDFNTVSPIVLPAGVQFVGPITFAGSGVSCTATSPSAPPPESPGGTITLNCASGTGTIGNDADITATFPVYIVDTLDENSCSTGSAINEAKHLTIQKGASGAGFPGSAVTFTIGFQVSEFVDGINRLVVTDSMPDGLTYDGSATVTYGGAPVPIFPTVTDDFPGAGETRLVFDVIPVTGDLAPATGGTITYTATIDQSYDAPGLAGQPLRARDTLSNSVVGDYDIQNGAAGCSDDSGAGITIPDVVSSKTLIGSPLVQPGDTVTWRLRLEVPSGDVQGIQFNDYFPLPVFDAATIDQTLSLASNPDISLNTAPGGDTVGADPTAISVNAAENRLTINWPDIVSTTGETIEADVSITVSDDPFADGLVLSNLLQAVTDNSTVDNAAGLNIANITLQEPDLSLTKTVTSASSGLEAGDTVTFDLTITNDGSAEAYDVLVTDSPDPTLENCTLDSEVGGSGAGSLFGAGWTATAFDPPTLNALDPGDSLVLGISCDVAAAAANNATIGNSAGVVWASQPGAVPFPEVQDSASVSTRQVQAFKAITATSEAHTGEGSADTGADSRPVVTGEIIRYRTWAYLPQGTLSNVVLRDLLPAGLTYVPGSRTLIGLVSTSNSLTASGLTCGAGTAVRVGDDSTDLSTLALDCELAPTSGGGGSGDDPLFSLGTVTNLERDANEELVVLEFNAAVDGTAAQGTQLSNQFRVQTANGNGTSAAAVAEQQAPLVDIVKQVIPVSADADDTVRYVITFQHNGGDTDAFDVAVNDVIQPDLIYDSGSGITGPAPPAVPGTDSCTTVNLTVDDSDPAGAGITISFDRLAVGDVCEISYFASTAPGVLPGQQIINTASLDYTSLPGAGTVSNPTGSPPGTEASLQSQDQATLTIDQVGLVKSIVSTSLPHTPDGTADTAGDPRTLAIGETLRYRLQVRLPEGDAPGFTVTDLLPMGLNYIAGSGRVALVNDGAGTITATPGITCSGGTLAESGNETSVAGITPSCGLEPAGAPFGSGVDPVWNLGDLMNSDMDANREFVLIEFDALVENETAAQSGTQLANSFEVSVDGNANSSGTVYAEIVEPQLTITSTVTPTPVDNRLDATPTFGWDITLSNTGTGTAFQIAAAAGGGWEIVLPVGVQDISNLTLTASGADLNGTTTPVALANVSIDSTNNSNDTLRFDQPLEMDAGGSLSLQFDASLLATVLPGDAPSLSGALTYAGQSVGDSAGGVRDDADQASGTGNDPITSTAALNDYRTGYALTVTTIAETPALSVAKTLAAGPVNVGDGTFTLTYAMTLTNAGDVNLVNVGLMDDMDAVFGAGVYVVDAVRVSSDSNTLDADPAFTGTGANTALLDTTTSTLPFGEVGSIEIDLTVTPGTNLGPLTNMAAGTSASERSGAAANDGTTVDVSFDEGAELGLAKRIVAPPTNNGDGTFTLTYELLIENSGAIVLDGVQATEDLAGLFSGATFVVDSVNSGDFAVNGAFDGAGDQNLLAGTDALSAGSSGTVQLTVTVTPGANLGPYAGNANVTATAPSGAALADVSDDGAVPDGDGSGSPDNDSDPTLVTFLEDPELGLAKAVVGSPTNNGDGTFTVTYRFVLENSGDVELRDLQLSDDLATVFAGASGFTVDSVASADFAVNFPGFDGSGNLDLLDGTDVLAAGSTGGVDLTITVTPGADLGPYDNTAQVSATSPAGTAMSDDSHSGAVPDGNGDGDPGTDSAATPVSFAEGVQIGLAMQVSNGPVNNADGTYTISYQLLVENTGAIVLNDLQLTDDLNAAFSGAAVTVDSLTASTLTVNGGYDGVTDLNLLAGTDSLGAGASTTLDLTVTVTPGANLGPHPNSATVSGASPAGANAVDVSDDAAVVDENGNGNPTDDNDSTVVLFTEAPVLGVSTRLAAAPVNNGDGSYTLTYFTVVENSGDILLRDLTASGDLATIFAGADSFILDGIASADLIVNPAYDGAADTELLAAGNDLPAGAGAEIAVTVTVVPGANLGPYLASSVTGATTPAGGAVADASVDGPAPDANGNGDPSDDASPTVIAFTENAVLGLAKTSTLGVPNYDGTFTTTVTLYLENLGDVSVSGVVLTDEVATRIAPATVAAIANVAISGDLSALDAGFDGVTVTSLTDGTEALSAGGSATVTFDLTFASNGNPGPFQNLASVAGESPGNPTPGTPNVTDDSTAGSDPDPDGNGDPTDNAEASAVGFNPGIDAVVDITDSSVPGELLSVTVTDSDENFDATLAESFQVTVLNDMTGESEVLTVVETGVDTGVFIATLDTVYGVAADVDDDGLLVTQLNDTVTVSYEDRLTLTGSVETVTDTGTVIGFATIQGNAWLDADANDGFDPTEPALEGWIIRVTQNDVPVVDVPVAANGSYSVPDLIPGAGYELTVVHPASGVTYGIIGDLTLAAEVILTDQNLPIDPSGVIYDSIERSPIEGATVSLVDDGGTPVPDACLLPGQQDQVTAVDGYYRFDFLAGADPACPSGGSYSLALIVPPDYAPGVSTLLPPESGLFDPTGLASPVRIGDSSGVPTLAESTTYYTEFELQTGDPDIVWNHVPLDPTGVGNLSVRLTKDVDQRTTSVGGLVSYRISVENLSDVSLPGVTVVDSLPPGFSYVADSASLDDPDLPLTVTGSRPVHFAGINLDPGERRELRYALRAGTGLAQGEYDNSATPFVGPAQIGNTDTARILVVADPDFEQTSVIGKVWNDRDRDGWQDEASAHRVRVKVALAEGSSPVRMTVKRGAGTAVPVTSSSIDGVVIDELPGRYGLADYSLENEAIIRARYAGEISVDRLEISTAEGTLLEVDDDGVRPSHRGKVASGLNSQAISASYQVRPVDGGSELVVRIRNDGFEEPGIPGVRLATVEGLLIETDAHGRYHIAGIDTGFVERGSNYIIKLDPDTVPDESIFTTENPRVKRLSRGLMNRFDFGVHVAEHATAPEEITVKVAEMYFAPATAEVLPGYQDSLRALVRRLEGGSLVNLRVEAHTDPEASASQARELAERRGQALITAIRELSAEDLSDQVNVMVEQAEVAGNAVADSAHAPGSSLAVMSDFLVQDRGVATVYDGVDGLEDLGRVDLLGDQVSHLKDGGTVWLTEDPMGLEPRLVVQGPSHLPIRGRLFVQDAGFTVYTNYAHFIETISIDVFRESDLDRRAPLATFEIDTRADKRLIYDLGWPLAGHEVPDGQALVYRATAVNGDGLSDRTIEQRAFIVDADLLGDLTAASDEAPIPIYGHWTVRVPSQTSREFDAWLAEQTGETSGPGQDPTAAEVTAVAAVAGADDAVVVFVPGRHGEEHFEFRPQFETLGTRLSEADRLALDGLVDDGQVGPVAVRVVGHTSSLPIAAGNRHLFADNHALSQARAQAVADYLRAGFADRLVAIEVHGEGPDQPIADNASVEGREANRRVDVFMHKPRPDNRDRAVLVPRDPLDAPADAGTTLDPEQGDALAGMASEARAELLQQLVTRNDLEAQRIPVYGSRVRVHGDKVGEDHALWLNGERVPTDSNERFAVEYLLPVGNHAVDLRLADSNGGVVERTLPVEVTGSYRFAVGLADFTLSGSDLSGSAEALTGDDRYAEDVLMEGRLAFYLKSRFKGKYLLSAQLDTEEESLEDLFSNLHKKDPGSLFRRLDPDRYYPVYGDDSTVIADVNSQGRMYARLNWDRSEALWGNYETGITGNELVQYSRGFYGARFTHESLAATEHDDSKTLLSLFASESQTALGHSELIGTGGSLYYLRHTDVLPGSERFRIEVRDSRTGRIIDNVMLTRGVDYEIDELQGRVILTRPLLQVSSQNAPSLVLHNPLGSQINVLVADYEYVPDGFDADNVVWGARGKRWIGDHVGIGMTYVDEGRDSSNYRLGGVDLTLKAAEGSWLKVEYGLSEATQTSRFLSTDGGLTFATSGPGSDDRDGDAYGVDLHLNAGDFGGRSDWVTNAWFKSVDGEFSIARLDEGEDVTEYGLETQLPLGDRFMLGARLSHLETENQFELSQAAIQANTKILSNGTLSAEMKWVEEVREGLLPADALLGAIQYEHRLFDSVSMFLQGQTALDASSGYEDNDQLSVGTKFALSAKTSGQLELRDGDRGRGLLGSLEHRLNERHTLYGTATQSVDTTEAPAARQGGASMLDNSGTNFAIGHRWALNDRTSLFTEGTHSRGDDFSALGHVFGLDYAAPGGWYFGLTLQDGALNSGSEPLDRQAYSASAGYQRGDLRFSTKLEYRQDSGLEEVEQWLTTNRIDYKLSDAFRLSAKLNFSESDNATSVESNAKLVESSLGLAHRPINHDRYNWLAKYTYLYDLQSLGQESTTADQRSHVVSWEGIYRLNQRFDLGGKLAHRRGELRLSRNAGPWYESTASFGSARVRWHVLEKWDAMAEYRYLRAKEAQNDQAGALISLDRHIADHFKIGVGYNFTDFSDDLTSLSYEYRGWFINLVGKY